MSLSKKKPTAIDLFCGSGAVTLGLKRAGFNVIGAIDMAPEACKTYKENHAEVLLVDQDISIVEPSIFKPHLCGRLDLVVVCAPCQPFSSQNRHKSKKDPRADLINESIKFIDEFLPKIVFLENVPGLESKPSFRKFVINLKKLGYEISDPMKIDASSLGVPQRRSRMIMIAVNGVSLSEAINIEERRRITVREAISELPEPPVGKENASNDPLHFARNHSKLNLRRLEAIPKNGGSRDSLPYELQLKCHRNTKSNSFSDVYGRMKWDDVSPTLTTGCTDITRGRFAHPDQNRSITLREAARLQSFPDDYIFSGNSSQISTQIGNAVPPLMMEVIAESLNRSLNMNSSLGISNDTAQD